MAKKVEKANNKALREFQEARARFTESTLAGSFKVRPNDSLDCDEGFLVGGLTLLRNIEEMAAEEGYKPKDKIPKKLVKAAAEEALEWMHRGANVSLKYKQGLEAGVWRLWNIMSKAKRITLGAGFKAKQNKIKLCPYHTDSLGWIDCTEGFKGCQVERARKVKQKNKRGSVTCRKERKN